MYIYEHKGLKYNVKECEPGDPDFDCRVKRKDGKLITDYPPAFIMTGRSGAKYGMFPSGTQKPGEPMIFKAYNLNEDQNYWATPFGQRGFTVEGGELRHTHHFRRKPRKRAARAFSGQMWMLPPRSNA